VRAEGEAIPAIPLSALRMFLKDTRVLSSDEVKQLPYVLGFEEARLRGTVGQNIYVRNLQAEPGQRWAIVRPTHTFRGFNENDRSEPYPLVGHELDSDASVVTTPWREEFRGDHHYGTGTDLGTEVTVIGTAETLRTGDISTLLLLDSTQEIRKGDRIMPIDDKPYDPYYYPHAPKAVADNSRVIGFTDALDAVGPHQVIAMSIGSRDGVENGQTYSIVHPGETINDDVASDSWNRGTGKSATLPEEFVGHVMVFRTFDRVSYGLVMDGIKPISMGDRLTMPE
jgi:hypothetical protein